MITAPVPSTVYLPSPSVSMKRIGCSEPTPVNVKVPSYNANLSAEWLSLKAYSFFPSTLTIVTTLSLSLLSATITSGVSVGEGLGDGVGVLSGVPVGVVVGVGVEVSVAVGVGVLDTEGVGVEDTDTVGVGVASGVDVGEGDGVGVGSGTSSVKIGLKTNLPERMTNNGSTLFPKSM